MKDSSSSRKAQPKSVCRFFHKGQCTWGLNCRFIHPGINDKGNYNMFSAPPRRLSSNQAENYHSSVSTDKSYILGFQFQLPRKENPYFVLPQHTEPEPYVPPTPPPPPREEPPPPESAWERGLRHAKEIIKKAIKRKETEPDFEEKRMNLTLVEGEIQADYEKEADYYPSQPRRRSEGESFYHYR